MHTDDLSKKREIQFDPMPPGQTPEALDALETLKHVKADEGKRELTVAVSYNLLQHTFQELETRLQDQGFHLDNSLLSKLKRALIEYSEEVQLDNLQSTEQALKARQIFAKVYEQRPQGDHDSTPEEWRTYR